MKWWSYTSPPAMGRTACTEPQCLHTGCTLPFTFSDPNIVVFCHPKPRCLVDWNYFDTARKSWVYLFRRPVAGKTRERQPQFLYSVAVRHGVNKACRESCCSCHGSELYPRHLLSVGSQTARRHHNLTLRPYPSESIAVATSSSFRTIFFTSRSTKATK